VTRRQGDKTRRGEERRGEEMMYIIMMPYSVE